MSDYLFANPSFLEGMGRVLDIGDTMTEYNKSLTEVEADFIALKNDWLALAEDLKATVSQMDLDEHQKTEAK